MEEDFVHVSIKIVIHIFLDFDVINDNERILVVASSEEYHPIIDYYNDELIFKIFFMIIFLIILLQSISS